MSTDRPESGSGSTIDITASTSKDPVDLARAIERALATPLDPAAAAALGTSMSWERVFEAELVDLKRLCR
jgi:hypothetical protein